MPVNSKPVGRFYDSQDCKVERLSDVVGLQAREGLAEQRAFEFEGGAEEVCSVLSDYVRSFEEAFGTEVQALQDLKEHVTDVLFGSDGYHI